MSASFVLFDFVPLEGGGERRDRDATARNELAARMADGAGERRRPRVLPDQHAGGAAGLDGGGDGGDVILGQQHREVARSEERRVGKESRSRGWEKRERKEKQ